MGTVAFVGLNPSTADEERDDPTIRRCIRYAQDWGFGRLEVVNLYGFRATTPWELWMAADPVGPQNDEALAAVVRAADLVVAAWGTHARPERLAELAPVLGSRPLHALGVTKNGAPRHPLYVRADVLPRLSGAAERPAQSPGQVLPRPAAVRPCRAPRTKPLRS